MGVWPGMRVPVNMQGEFGRGWRPMDLKAFVAFCTSGRGYVLVRRGFCKEGGKCSVV